MENQLKLIVITKHELIKVIENVVKKEVNELLDEFRAAEKDKKMPEYLDRRQVSKYYGVSKGTIHNWEKEGKLTRTIIGDKTIRYPKSEVLALAKTRMKRS